jgi:mRNA interferase MazF
MVERLTRGGIYLARLDPAKGAEIGKLRPVAVLSAEEILKAEPPLVFVCPLSSRSDPGFASLHLPLPARDALKVPSFALVEHCRAMSSRRLKPCRIAQLTAEELDAILNRLQRLVGR